MLTTPTLAAREVKGRGRWSSSAPSGPSSIAPRHPGVVEGPSGLGKARVQKRQKGQSEPYKPAMLIGLQGLLLLFEKNTPHLSK
jgi:hypothetical protein